MFLVNSRHPLVCAPRPGLPQDGARFSRSYAGNLPSSFNTVLSSASVCSTSPPVSVSGTVLTPGLFPGTRRPPGQSDQPGRLFAFVTPGRLGSINPIPIGYGFRPHLRGRLTLRGLALRRNPWTFGERVSHPLCRYSCQHSHFRYLQRRSHATFIGLRNAPLPLRCQIRTERSTHLGSTRSRRLCRPCASSICCITPESLLIDIAEIEAVPAPHRISSPNRGMLRKRRNSAACPACLPKPSATLTQIDLEARRTVRPNCDLGRSGWSDEPQETGGRHA